MDDADSVSEDDKREARAAMEQLQRAQQVALNFAAWCEQLALHSSNRE